ncbi:MAG: helix-turn-helix domain-containing protein [Defluviitaleaceae bacterium]|nr:helix-turn-helix domain-containing protein [Defluviitaleaceae bacterium]
MNPPHPTPLSIGEKIKQIRMAKGLSQENLAQAITEA